ncbi:MAG: sigma-70 family RNA polymerase sigma factor [Candidatus Poribacteria bacterium]|nr:sigma-70 family RNA polymerase sigma factor [Candidatus Poribacteria bacterium]
MKNEDVDLIQRVLSGDERAFTALVERHRKWVHSLAWREIGDFHAAQEITQDTFIQAYKSLPSLRDPNRFSGWLHVIAKRQCIEWLRRKPMTMQSLDAMPNAELERVSYARYLDEERTQASTDGLREVVERLLQKLPVNERSVMVLHYYKGLTCEEVSVLLDVSLNTIKSRLYRARKRLETEESMLRETLDTSILKSEPRRVDFQATAATETGKHLAEGDFNFNRTDRVFTSSGFHTSGRSDGDPSPMYMLLHYLNHGGIDLFRFPLVVGSSWEDGGAWKSQATATLEGCETVSVSAGTFSTCLKHKTVFMDADVEDADAELRNALVNGTRYLWFAKGVGLVKMRYEHSNGVVTEAELIKYETPLQDEAYFPAQIGTQWTYKWHNTYRDEAVIEEWRVIRNFRRLENLENPMELASARYAVKIEADNPRLATVECVLTPKASHDPKGERKPLLLSMSRFGTEWLDGGYGHYLRDLTVTDANGKALVIEEIDKTQWAVETQDESPVTLHYKVLLNHDEREWHWGRDEAPYAQDDCVFWPGYALFVVGEVDDVELCVDVPDNWSVSTPWERIEPDRHRFVCKDQNDLMYAYLVLGEHAERLVEAGTETKIVLALGGHLKGAMDEIEQIVAALLHTYSGIFGGAPKDQLLFAANPYGEKGYRSGGASRRSMSMLIGETLDEANRGFWLPPVARLVCYLWNGSYIDIRDGTGAIGFKEQEYWFCAGFTQYYSEIVSVRLGLTSETDFLRNLERTWEGYLSRQGELSIHEAGEDKSANRELVYDGGSLIAAALDLQIRSLTGNRSSLDDVMRQMYREFGLTGVPYTMSSVIRIVSRMTGADFKPFFREYVTGTEQLPLEEYLKDAGVDVEIEFGERLPRLHYILRMLRISAIGGPPGGGMFIDSSPQYQNNDQLVGINGTPVKTFDDIRKVAVDWKSGDVVELTLRREGKEIVLPVTLGGDVSKNFQLEVDTVDVTITKRVDATESQRAILTGILGES